MSPVFVDGVVKRVGATCGLHRNRKDKPKSCCKKQLSLGKDLTLEDGFLSDDHKARSHHLAVNPRSLAHQSEAENIGDVGLDPDPSWFVIGIASATVRRLPQQSFRSTEIAPPSY